MNRGSKAGLYGLEGVCRFFVAVFYSGLDRLLHCRSVLGSTKGKRMKACLVSLFLLMAACGSGGGSQGGSAAQPTPAPGPAGNYYKLVVTGDNTSFIYQMTCNAGLPSEVQHSNGVPSTIPAGQQFEFQVGPCLNLRNISVVRFTGAVNQVATMYKNTTTIIDAPITLFNNGDSHIWSNQ
jgi:hypothetical protein